MSEPAPLVETVTLGQARGLIRALASEQSVLLLSPPGVGKSDLVRAAAVDGGLPCKSLLGTQIAPEDVSGVPRIVGERSVFCPPRVLLPEDARPFCLFLDELPACAPDVQKAFYSLLLERRIGEFPLPPGSWVVAAGNRAEDRALVRTISSALVNRVLVLNIRVDVPEWLVWAQANGVRADVRAFIQHVPDALLRPVPDKPAPFSTPRAWASLSRALDLVDAAGILDDAMAGALALGRVSETDARLFLSFRRRGDRSFSELELLLNQSIADLDLSVRATNCLESEGITLVRDLVVRTPEELLEIRNFSETTLRQVVQQLGLRGLTLGMTVPPRE